MVLVVLVESLLWKMKVIIWINLLKYHKQQTPLLVLKFPKPLIEIFSGYGEFMSCTQEFVTKIPLCSNGSTKFIQEYLERNIGSPLMVSSSIIIITYQYQSSYHVRTAANPPAIPVTKATCTSNIFLWCWHFYWTCQEGNNTWNYLLFSVLNIKYKCCEVETLDINQINDVSWKVVFPRFSSVVEIN